ncbi:protein-L-isoaspartate(D-aspartate) O-methyltransferase [Halosquirtibacter xylanolyticus]|uniref:protein-L-isoaspartate(D-aspartate) O-methyltransferase n=1 Tax=Halosquirtibacter xylanolyticus TaxID=3374599 RepID=UPI00374A7E5B|nr:protein-L-isoaspartate(D-aspartate) O-methyltransferase [Prolixibacteraceae bacterium]
MDNIKHRGLRKRLVQQLAHKGNFDPKVMEAMLRVPRHLFIEPSFLRYAYQDMAFPIGCGQTISQPFTVAAQTSLLEVAPRMKVLEIGTGSGYQSAVLCDMGANLFSIERHLPLHEQSKQLLEQLTYRPRLYYADGYIGLPTIAPFDRILITAAAPEIPQQLLKQLGDGGIMVVPVGEGKDQEMIKIRRCGDQFQTENHGAFSFVPMLKGRE